MPDQVLEYLRPAGFGADDLTQALGPGERVRRAAGTAVRRLLCDTFDGRLYRRGEVLEAMEELGSTALVWRRLGGVALRRLVAPRPRFARDLPPGAFRDRLEKVTEMRALLPLVLIETHGQALEIQDDEGKIVCRVFNEEHRAGAPGKRKDLRPLPPRVRIETVRGYPGAAKRVREALAGVAVLQPVGQDVLEEALALQGRRPPSYSSRIRISLAPGMTAAEAIQHLLLGILETLEINEEGTRGDLDSEFLHDFRVAVRRTRSALGQLKPVFPAAALKKFRAGFGWLGEITGPTRDLDVHLLEFPRYQAALPATAAANLEPLRVFLEHRRRAKQRALARALGGRRYRKLVGDWRAFLEAGPEPWVRHADAPDAGRPVRDVAGGRIRRVLRRALREGRAIGDRSPPADLHELRKTCKKLRYLLEFFRSLYPTEEADTLVGALKGLQDSLGEYQDVHVQSAALRGFAEEMAGGSGESPATYLALGMLLERLRVREGELRGEFAQRFGAFAREATPGRFPALLGARETAIPSGEKS
jgi:CHAD domain-containing protein